MNITTHYGHVPTTELNLYTGYGFNIGYRMGEGTHPEYKKFGLAALLRGIETWLQETPNSGVLETTNWEPINVGDGAWW